MQRHPSETIAAMPRDKLLWPVLVAMVAAQLLAFWMLCSHQVRKAEVRDATLAGAARGGGGLPALHSPRHAQQLREPRRPEQDARCGDGRGKRRARRGPHGDEHDGPRQLRLPLIALPDTAHGRKC